MATTELPGAVAEESSPTRSVFEEARRYIPGGTSRIHYYYEPYPIYGRSAAGCHLTDVEGVERTDYLNNMTSLIHGHGDPAINRAIIDQLERGTAWSEPSVIRTTWPWVSRPPRIWVNTVCCTAWL